MGMLWVLIKWVVGVVVIVWGALAFLDWIGPTEPLDLNSQFDPSFIGEDLDAYLQTQEDGVRALRPGAQKRIVWAGEPGEKTPLSIVYLHGFSASSEEIRPVPDLVAEGLGANLYFARLFGHGQDGAAMAEAEVRHWISDLDEAMEIGRRLGERVVLMGTSTGGTLAVIAATDPEIGKDLAGIAMVSPNLRVAGFGGRLIEWPGARFWGPVLIGKERSFEPRSDGHAAFWTTRYPTVAVATLGALVNYTRGLDFSKTEVPALFFVSQQDQVVDAKTSRQIAGRWGANGELVPIVMTEEDDPSGHILAGDILSPNKTAPFVERILSWAQQL